jgi:hypothetical protein
MEATWNNSNSFDYFAAINDAAYLAAGDPRVVAIARDGEWLRFTGPAGDVHELWARPYRDRARYAPGCGNATTRDFAGMLAREIVRVCTACAA